MKPHPQGKVYVDNDFNRRHNRVGKPLGSVPIPRGRGFYVDNAMNRHLGRVGEPYGTRVMKKKELAEVYRFLEQNPENEDIFEDSLHQEEILNHVLETMNREREIANWLEDKPESIQWDPHNHVTETVLESFDGNVIDFNDIDLKDKIGHGGFGDVYFGLWKKMPVAVKKLKQQRVTKKRKAQFQSEIAVYCSLEHPNIVRFLGACVQVPNLAIVMEFMDSSLYDTLHIKEVDMLNTDKLKIIRDVAHGINYLHNKSIAHCDLKTKNVLLNNVKGEQQTNSCEAVIAKITDFGLSMMKSDVDTSTSYHQEGVQLIGTPLFSAPEVLRGEMLNLFEMMNADIYSLGLLYVELITEEIPFEDLKHQQLVVNVGNKGMKPELPHDLVLDKELHALLQKCWSFKPEERPKAHKVASVVDRLQMVYVEDEE